MPGNIFRDHGHCVNRAGRGKIIKHQLGGTHVPGQLLDLAVSVDLCVPLVFQWVSQ